MPTLISYTLPTTHSPHSFPHVHTHSPRGTPPGARNASLAWAELPCTRSPRHRLPLGPPSHTGLTWTAQPPGRGRHSLRRWEANPRTEAPHRQQAAAAAQTPGVPAPRAARAKRWGGGVAGRPPSRSWTPAPAQAGPGWTDRRWRTRGR